MIAVGPLIMFLAFGLVIVMAVKVLRTEGGSLDDLGLMFYDPSRSGNTGHWKSCANASPRAKLTAKSSRNANAYCRIRQMGLGPGQTTV